MPGWDPLYGSPSLAQQGRWGRQQGRQHHLCHPPEHREDALGSRGDCIEARGRKGAVKLHGRTINRRKRRKERKHWRGRGKKKGDSR